MTETNGCLSCKHRISEYDCRKAPFTVFNRETGQDDTYYHSPQQHRHGARKCRDWELHIPLWKRFYLYMMERFKK